MGSKPHFFLSFPRGAAGKALAAGALAMVLASCISDGSNTVGGDFLTKHGILFQDSLIHVKLKAFPVDSSWTTDAEARHLGDSVILAGHTGDFSAEPRLAFRIENTALLDSLSETDTNSLNLSLKGFSAPFAREELAATVSGDSTHPAQDSLRFEVLSWDTTNADLSSDEWNNLVNETNNKFLIQGDTVAALPPPSARDTITLAVRKAYDTTGVSQVKPLPNLYKRLRLALDEKHVVQMRLIPIFDTATDSGSAMLRLGGQLGDGDGIYSEPLLLFRKFAPATTYPTSLIQPTLYTRTNNSGTNNRRGVNYTLRYWGPNDNMLTVKRRGLHVVLNRKELLDSINAQLRLRNKTVPPPATGEFDLTYFVPFAKIALPLDLAGTSLEGGFPLEMQLISSTDTLLQDNQTGLIRVDEVGLGKEKVIWNTFETGSPGKVVDDVAIAYVKVGSDSSLLRRVDLTYSKDSALNDTTFLAVGETKQVTTSLMGFGSGSYLTLQYEAGAEALTVRSYLTVHSTAELNEFRDPATGETITDMERRVSRFLQPGQDTLTLRATRGMQTLLNRTGNGTSFIQDFVFQPVAAPAADITVNVNGSTSPAKVPYPVLSVIEPRFGTDSLTVDVDLYLFPLKAR